MKKVILSLVAACAALFAADCEDAMIKAIVDGSNKSVPARLDEVTTLSGVTCENGRVNYLYTLNDSGDIKFSEFTNEQNEIFKNIQESIVKQNYCGISAYVDATSWIYVLEDGKPFVTINMEKKDCEN